MFTGLIESTGTVERARARDGGHVLSIATPIGRELRAGDSISVNGVCLTVTTTRDEGFDVDVSPETLRVTTLGQFEAGRLVNLERPLRADARLGGHFVLGHVDGVGRIASLTRDGECYWLDVEAPASLAPYLITKGSIAIDGISLTIARLTGQIIGVQIIPFTWEHTGLHRALAGDAVNLEADVLGKYVARLMEARVGDRGAAAGSAGTV
jgi:riboflavin synthase